MKKVITFIVVCLLSLAVLGGCSWSADKGGDDNFNNDETTADDEGTNGGNDELPSDYGDGDKHIHGEVNELLTVEELVEFHLNGAKYPENFVFEELIGYGRVIESSSSQEDALSTATEHFNNDYCTVVENRLMVETDLFYGLYVKWAFQRDETETPYYYDEYVVSFKKHVYDFQNKQLSTNDKDVIKSILNYLCYSRSYQTAGTKVYSSDVSIKDDKFVYTAYVLTVVYGDWGVHDALAFIKAEMQIDMATGKMTHTEEVVGTVFIDGSGMLWGGEV